MPSPDLSSPGSANRLDPGEQAAADLLYADKAIETLGFQSPGIVWVDGERDPVAEGYTEDGTPDRPFKTVEDGVAASYATRGTTERQMVRLLPSQYIIPYAKLPIVLSDRIFIVGTSVESTIVRPANGVDKDIFEIDYSGVSQPTFEFYNMELVPQVSGRAAINIKSSISRCRIRNLWVFAAGAVSDIFVVKVSHTTGAVFVIADQINLFSELLTSLGLVTGVDFGVQDAGDCLVAYNCNFSQFKTNATAVASDMRLSHCRIGHEKITGGNAAQKIFAAYCRSDNGDGTVAALDADDFQGLHTKTIVGGGGVAAMMFPTFLLYANDWNNPNNADWIVNALAPIEVDPTNNAIDIRAFPQGTEKGIGREIRIPAGATNMVLTPFSSAKVGEAGVRTVGNKLYFRKIPEGSAISGTWAGGDDGSKVLNDQSFPATTAFRNRDNPTTLVLATEGIIAGQLYQFEYTRIAPAAGTELGDDWYLEELEVEFT